MRTKWMWLIATLLMSGGLSASDFKIGPDGALDSLALSAGQNNYLVVWRDLRGGASVARILGAMVSNTGVVSTEFPISDAASLPLESLAQRATVAFDGANFLVVWADNRVGGAGIRGARVSPQGVVLSADFLIAAISRSDNLAPLVIFTGADYVVAWQDNPASATGSQIFFTRVAVTGAPGAASALPIAVGQNVSQILEFLVAGPANEALIVFQDAAVTPNVTRATRVGADNSLLGAQNGAQLFKRDFSSEGFGAPIGAAFDGAQYIILSSHDAQMDSSVFKTTLAPSGSVIRSATAIAEVGQGKTGLAEDSFPRAFFNGNHEFLFMRNSKVSESAYHLLVKRVTTGGIDRDPNLPIIDSASRGVLNGAAAAAISAQYLVVWMDGRLPEYQPSRQMNLFAAFLDGGQAGDESLPILKAQARAWPTIGNSPLTVAFGAGGSSGSIDSLQWDFGDGAFATTSPVARLYKTKGDFCAVLTLTRSGFSVHDFVRILVDSDALGGGGGPPESVGGSLGPISDGVDTKGIVSSIAVGLNFAAEKSDSLRFLAFLNPSLLPISLTNKQGSLVLAGKTYPFTLDVNGLAISAAGQTPITRVMLNRFTGAFLLTSASDDLIAAFAALGAANETISKPGKEIDIPCALTFGDLQLNLRLTAKYTAKEGKVGHINYLLSSIGYPNNGYLRVSGAKAVESGGANKVHAFTIVGVMNLGGEQKLTRGDVGNWRITLGNYIEDLSVDELTVSGDTIFYKAPKGKVGITRFIYNTRVGFFGLAYKQTPAEGAIFSGMPLASSSVMRADMALSFDLALSNGGKYQASIFTRFGRNKVGSKKWRLR